MKQAKQYIYQALEHDKLDDPSFDFKLSGYKQESMKETLKILLLSIDNLSSLPIKYYTI